MSEEKKLLESEIENLNEEIKELAYRLGGLLDVDCNLGVCSYDPEAEDIQKKMEEVQKKKALLKKLRENLDTCRLD